MIDLSNSMAVVFACKNHPARRTTIDWLREHVPKVYLHWKEPAVAARNTAIRDLVLPEVGTRDWCLFVDNDVTITHPGVERWLEVPGDVVACRWGGPNTWHSDPTAFHQTLWRARPEVFARIEPPWFFWEYTDDGCDVKYPCDCEYFRQKALAAEVEIRHGGRCSHQQSRSWCSSS
jgi:hypothetical protein